MCGRYQSYVDDDELFTIIKAARADAARHISEVFPTDRMPLILSGGAVSGCWGFPAPHGGGVIINARAETVCEKPIFSRCISASRCVVPSSGFFEWTHGGGQKEKYLFTLDGEPMLKMAGLYCLYNGEVCYVILTTAANSSISDVHSRMPLVLSRESAALWLDDMSEAKRLLTITPPGLIRQAV